ncbi:hypothetical protein BB934_31010 (plasmid) [Microvirga ossetica]|uniref:Uncharacterized protein n=1 Tax=Microvirga ossetica TaxID=1882682 RepID=A0A1B2ERV2_9HYPH|nr:hypothetical protein [Microvirga ossetica]ANY82689.1 hypothetical protein BB934_31010 [Microvirga ossetica]
MDESFSPTIFLYGMALVFAVGKAFTLTIWRTLPKPRPGLKHEMLQAWKKRRFQKQAAKNAVEHPRSEWTADNPLSSTNEATGEPHAAAPPPEKEAMLQPRPNAHF